MCNKCNQNICECGKTVVLLNPIGGSASMTNVGGLLPAYVTGTSVPFEMRTIGAAAPSNNILDYGFQAVQTATEITLKYNPLRGNTLFVDATFGDDLTALPNHEDACYQTVTGAVAAASSGDLIIVNAGFYDCAAAVGDVLLWKDGVNIYCHPNVQLNVGTINWDFAMTINVDTGIYGYAEMYIDALSTSPTPFVEGFLSGFDVPPTGYLGEQIPTTTLEINNLYFTNAVDFQHLIVRYKSNVYIRNNIYGNKIGAGASWVYVEGNTSQINVRFTTCYNAPAYEVGQLLNVDPIDIMVNVEYNQILTKGYDPTYGVVRIRKNAANGYPVSVASVDKNNPINVKLKGDIIHENTTIPTFGDFFSNIFSITDNIWAEYTGRIEQKYDTAIMRADGDSISASYNTLFKFKDSTIIMPDDSLIKSLIYTSRGIGDEVQEIYVLDNTTIIMSRATAVLAVNTIYVWENTNAGSFVDFLCYGLKTNVDCTSAATMFDNVAANTVTLDTSLTFIMFDAYINN